MTPLQKVTLHFNSLFNTLPPIIVQAPGRVNLIGEHTDYNDGFVLPMAIDRGIWLALRPRSDDIVSIYSVDLDKTAVFPLQDLKKTGDSWAEYPKGVAWALKEAGYPLQGWEGVMSGNVPRGAGLSSSAAVELATARAFQASAGFDWQPDQMARLSQRAENDWVGVNCGIMDQMISAAGAEGHALLIDCRSLQHELVPMPCTADGNETAVVVLDTATRRGLVDSAYNERRTQCEAAAQYFEVKALRDVSISELLDASDGLDPLTRQRAKHVVTENLRTLNAAKAMTNNDPQLLGQLMNESHASLRDDFEVSSIELDTMVGVAQALPGCLGARMTGAGFGGCAVALVDRSFIEGFVTAVAKQYQSATGLTPQIYICKPSAGASQLK